MSNRPIFKLDPRLQLCAKMVRDGAKIADIGTDHAYLPIWLAKQNIIQKGIAADLRNGPLEHAKINIHKYKVDNIVTTCLSNGLRNIYTQQVDDIIIAGMGGELISDIISKADWLKDENKQLILQPMTSAEQLRRFLEKENFIILEERAVVSEKHVYSVMLARYTNNKIQNDEVYPYIGLLNRNIDEFAITYIKKQIVHLENKIKGLTISGNSEQADKLFKVSKELAKLIKI